MRGFFIVVSGSKYQVSSKKGKTPHLCRAFPFKLFILLDT